MKWAESHEGKTKLKQKKPTTNNRNPTTIDHRLKTIISITKTWLTFPNSTQTKSIQFYLFTNDGRHQYFVSLRKTKISCAGFSHIKKEKRKKVFKESTWNFQSTLLSLTLIELYIAKTRVPKYVNHSRKYTRKVPLISVEIIQVELGNV